MKNKKIIAFVAVLLVASISIGLILWGNSALQVTKINVKAEGYSKNLNGFKIAHVSDLHNALIGDENEKLLFAIKEAEPDIIAITGDLIDTTRSNVSVCLAFLEDVAEIAPCYYVVGNHEKKVPEEMFLEIETKALSCGINVLRNQTAVIEYSSEKITLIGVDDPYFFGVSDDGDSASVISKEISRLMPGDDTYKILLSHRPEIFSVYVESGVDLVLSGHAHGGQFRFPFVGGLFAPHQGIFPEYDSGLFTQNNTNMIVSRGIGNSDFPLRIGNRPELIVVEIKS